jgi:hypothetical protein
VSAFALRASADKSLYSPDRPLVAALSTDDALAVVPRIFDGSGFLTVEQMGRNRQRPSARSFSCRTEDNAQRRAQSFRCKSALWIGIADDRLESLIPPSS